MPIRRKRERIPRIGSGSGVCIAGGTYRFFVRLANAKADKNTPCQSLWKSLIKGHDESNYDLRQCQ